MTSRADDANFLDNCHGITTIWEITAGVKLAVFPKFNHHRMTTDITVETGRLIFYLDLFDLGFSFFKLNGKRFIELIDDLHPFTHAVFDIVQ